MLRLKKLKIEKFRGLAPTELEFSDGINVLLGKNGSGKTTLLELISAIVTSSLGTLREESVRFEALLVQHGHSLRLRLEWEPSPRTGLGPRVEREPDWTYEAVLVPPGGKELGVRATSGMPTEARNPPPSPFLHGFLFSLMDWMVQPSDFWVGSALRFDEALGVFEDIVAPARGEGAYVAMTFGPGGSSSGTLAFIPDEMLNVFAQADPTTEPSFDRSEECLRRFCEVVEGDDVRAVPKRVSARDDGVAHERRYEGFDIWVRFGNTEVSHSRLSFGQKRLFAFYWYSACNRDGVIIADELVNGLHHSWIRACIEEIGDRQAFLASQNPLLLDYLSFGSPDDVRKTFVRCSVEKTERGGRRWEWRKPDAAEAELFYRSYEVGIRHVSEILRTQGLW